MRLHHSTGSYDLSSKGAKKRSETPSDAGNTSIHSEGAKRCLRLTMKGNGPTGFDVKFGDMTLTLVCGFRYSFFFFFFFFSFFCASSTRLHSIHIVSHLCPLRCFLAPPKTVYAREGWRIFSAAFQAAHKVCRVPGKPFGLDIYGGTSSALA